MDPLRRRHSLLEGSDASICPSPDQPSSSSMHQPTEEIQEPIPKRTKTSHPFFEYMATSGELDPRVAPKETTRQKLSKELKVYAKTPQIPVEEDPLKWWAGQAINFPVLAQVARKLLAIPASSAPSERVFSKLARINAKDRSSMKPSLANALLMH